MSESEDTKRDEQHVEVHGDGTTVNVDTDEKDDSGQQAETQADREERAVDAMDRK